MATYDLRTVSAKLAPFSRRRRRILTAVSIFLIAFILFFVGLDYQALATDS